MFTHCYTVDVGDSVGVTAVLLQGACHSEAHRTALLALPLRLGLADPRHYIHSLGTTGSSRPWDWLILVFTRVWTG